MQIETPPQFEGTLGNYPLLVQDMFMRSAAFVQQFSNGSSRLPHHWWSRIDHRSNKKTEAFHSSGRFCIRRNFQE